MAVGIALPGDAIHGMKKLLCLGLLLSIVPFALVHASTHDIFSQILADHVRDGWVDYRSLKNDARLDTYIMQLAGTNPDSIPSREEKLAFWINAYNAYTLKIITDNYPVKSIRDLNKGLFGGSVWDQQLVTINGEKTTLNTIEHKIIRPLFNEPRIHFALVCAAKSCPPPAVRGL